MADIGGSHFGGMNYSYDTEMDLADHRAIKVSTMQREKLLRTMQATAQATTSAKRLPTC